ncbi:MAG: YheU family protein [Myxococcota bacterium]
MTDAPSDDDTAPVFLRIGDLSPQALAGVIESFVLREGTDYGHEEHSLEEKVASVRAQLERGEARIAFDPVSESVTILHHTR